MLGRERQANVARQFAWVAAAAAVFVVSLAVGSGSQQLGIAFFYVIPVALASWFLGFRAGLLSAFVCTALFAASTQIHSIADPVTSTTLRAIIFIATAAAFGALRRSSQRLKLTSNELRELRDVLTPPALPELRDVEVAAAFLPAEHEVAGDFFLVTNSADGSVVAVVGDVVGHGTHAARLATFTRANFATFASNSSNPEAILRFVNDALAEHRQEPVEFVTAVCAAYRPADGSVRWASAGHLPPIKLPDAAELDVTNGAPPLGLETELTPVSQLATLRRDQTILLYTDGLVEARRGRERFGTDRVLEVIRDGPPDPTRLVNALREAVINFAGAGLDDDVCILALRPKA